jgi:hypothetical protein
MAERLNNIEIAARIQPTLLRWPAPEIAKAIALDKLREAADSLRALMRLVDDGCIASGPRHQRDADQQSTIHQEGT